jgi:hypothetical protein
VNALPMLLDAVEVDSWLLGPWCVMPLGDVDRYIAWNMLLL